MKRIKHTYSTVAIILLIVIASIFSIVGGGVTEAHAAATTSGSSGSDVLEDLKKDPNFKAELYPINAKDYSLSVIQIAESTEGELLVYVYKPNFSSDIKASSINIARQANDKAGLTFLNYKLTYLNSSGVFEKYRVENFKLDTAAVRYYNISNILRPFNKLIDEEPGGDNTVSEVPNAVGQLWTVYTVDGAVNYSMTTVETITITEKYVGYVTYDDGVNVGWGITKGATYAHFVAFDTDRPIDKLIEADVEFAEQEVTCKYCNNPMHVWHYKKYYDYEYGEVKEHDPITLTYKDKGSNTGGSSLRPSNKYTWDRIRSTDEFIKDENNKDYHLNSNDNIDDTKWVLSFYETPLCQKTDNMWLPLVNGFASLFVGDADVKFTGVRDVMILRLKFETDGVTYNLGVVDNKQTGNGTSENSPNENKITTTIGNSIKKAAKTVGDWFKNLFKKIPVWGWILIALAAVGIIMGILSIFFPVFKVVFKAIWTGVKFLLYAIGWIIALPFRLIGKLCGGIKNRIEERRERNEYLRAEKIGRKDRAVLERYQNKLDRKESNYRKKLDGKDRAKKQKRKAQAKKRSSKK